MTISKTTRRGLFAGLAAALVGLVWHRSAESADRTPGAAEGPFYPTPGLRLPDVDNDLVRTSGRTTEAGGEVIILKGRIGNADGVPLAGRRIEIWQCDMNGKYLHPGDSRSILHDAGFQGFGHDITDADGNYRFRTIKPAHYPGRTPHIHVKVLDGDRELLTTQFYIGGHPQNHRDSLYRRLSKRRAEMVSMTFREGSDGLETTVNVVV